MPAQFTGTPIDVSAAPLVQTEQAAQGTVLSVGANLYMVLGNNAGIPVAAVFKSTDNGATWAEQDAANHPISLGTGNSFVLDSTTGIIHITFRVTGAGGVKYIQFDTNTNTYGAAVLCPTANFCGAGSLIVRLSTGQLWVYGDNAANACVIERCQIIASVWQATQVVYNNGGGGTTPQAALPHIVVDATDTTHLVFTEFPVPINPGDTFNLKYFQISSGGAISLVSTIASEIYNGGAFVPFDWSKTGGPVIAFGNTLLIPNVNTVINNPDTVANMYVGTPLAVPVWTPKTIGGGLNPTVDQSGVVPLAVSGTLAYIFFVYQDGAAIFQLYYATFDGTTVSAPVLYWDAVANPTAPAGVPPLLSGFTYPVLIAAAGRLGVAISAGFNGAQTTVFYLAVSLTPGPPAPPPPPLTYWNPGSSLIVSAALVSFPPSIPVPNAAALSQLQNETAANAAIPSPWVAKRKRLPCQSNDPWSENQPQKKTYLDYPWLIPPEQRIPIHLRNSIPSPAANVLTALWSYTVPDGFTLVYDRLLFFAEIAGFVQGSGALIFTLDVNTPPTGRPLAKFTTTVGELSEPLPVAPVQLTEGNTLRAQVITDNTLGVGLPNVITAAVEGWLYPHLRL